MREASIAPFFVRYIAVWTLFCLGAVAILVWDRKRLMSEWREYWRFLAIPWKLWLFMPAFLFVTFAGRFTNDETWDVVTGSGMALLTFLTAPWVVGVIYLVFVGRRPVRYLIVASALMLFSSSWFYDGYLLWRDGAYTARWLGNLMLSPLIYIAAGLLWNLEAKARTGFYDDSGFRLSFVREDWPSRPVDTRFGPVLFVSIPLILIAAFVLVAFVGWKVGLFR
jgi:hypothetical protein